MKILNSGGINTGYKKAIDFATDHYENFPVISFLIPKELRKHIAIIYWFARTADDFADEGNYNEEVRILNLDDFENRLTQLLKKKFSNDYEIALAETINSKNLDSKLFYDLISAFKQDVIKKRYLTFEESLDYCRRSANPVGRLILQIYNIRNEKAFYYSDKICTALQLTNFFQDLSIDYQKGRIYLAQNEMQKFQVDESVFELKKNNLNLRKLLEYNILRARNLFEEGKNLLSFLNGKLKLQIKWTILGGEEILNKIEKNNYNVLENRPVLVKKDFIKLFLKSLI